MNPMFYFLLALTAVLAVTGSPGEPVLDIHGDIIFDGSYYVLPRISGPGGGGLTLSSRGDDWSNLNIHMDVKAMICGQSTYWYIKKIKDALGGYKIVFCVNNNDCSDIGIFVRFMKATETETSTKPIMSII
ncbi:unnamed protein product [Brassica rapa]|uniref:Uncharacterized protein n=1 Tax=Brassica campestris TaxID=3711 RepID=A0A3P6AH14_BRACM|nr:unnamed protein product [Brassica rapa]VDC88599.1 unnamed protein product [Brassica rapa]